MHIPTDDLSLRQCERPKSPRDAVNTPEQNSPFLALYFSFIPRQTERSSLTCSSRETRRALPRGNIYARRVFAMWHNWTAPFRVLIPRGAARRAASLARLQPTRGSRASARRRPARGDIARPRRNNREKSCVGKELAWYPTGGSAARGGRRRPRGRQINRILLLTDSSRSARSCRACSGRMRSPCSPRDLRKHRTIHLSLIKDIATAAILPCTRRLAFGPRDGDTCRSDDNKPRYKCILCYI